MRIFFDRWSNRDQRPNANSSTHRCRRKTANRAGSAEGFRAVVDLILDSLETAERIVIELGYLEVDEAVWNSIFADAVRHVLLP